MPSGRTKISPKSRRGLGHVISTIFGRTVGYPSDSLASCQRFKQDSSVVSAWANELVSVWKIVNVMKILLRTNCDSAGACNEITRVYPGLLTEGDVTGSARQCDAKRQGGLIGCGWQATWVVRSASCEACDPLRSIIDGWPAGRALTSRDTRWLSHGHRALWRWLIVHEDHTQCRVVYTRARRCERLLGSTSGTPRIFTGHLSTV